MIFYNDRDNTLNLCSFNVLLLFLPCVFINDPDKFVMVHRFG